MKKKELENEALTPETTESAGAADKGRKKSRKKGKNFFQRVARWFREMRSELKKVVWPSGKQILKSTIVALVIMAVAAIVIWGFDEVAYMGVQALITLAG